MVTIRIRGRNLRRLLFFCSSVRPIRRAICSARSRSVNSLRTGFPRSARAQPRPRCRRRPRPAPLATPSPTAVQTAANITLRGARATRDVRDASEIPGSRAAVLEVRKPTRPLWVLSQSHLRSVPETLAEHGDTVISRPSPVADRTTAQGQRECRRARRDGVVMCQAFCSQDVLDLAA